MGMLSGRWGGGRGRRGGAKGGEKGARWGGEVGEGGRKGWVVVGWGVMGSQERVSGSGGEVGGGKVLRKGRGSRRVERGRGRGMDVWGGREGE